MVSAHPQKWNDAVGMKDQLSILARGGEARGGERRVRSEEGQREEGEGARSSPLA